LNLRRALWATRPESNRLAYYSFLARRALRRKYAEIGKDVVVEYDGVTFLMPRNFREVLYDVYIDCNEPLTYKFMANMTGVLFVDVGANVGGYTVR